MIEAPTALVVGVFIYKRFESKVMWENYTYTKRAGVGAECINEGVSNVYKHKKIKHFKYKKVRRGWIVVNCKNGNHAHFRSEYGCYLIIKFLLEGVYPDNTYLQESYERLCTGKEKKQKYININKGVRAYG